MAKFKDRLKELREESGLSQPQLAEKLFLSKGTIGNYESGAREPKDLRTLENIADFFNVDIDYLLGRTNKKPEYTLEEQWIINCYRLANTDTKQGIKSILRQFEQDMLSKVG